MLFGFKVEVFSTERRYVDGFPSNVSPMRLRKFLKRVHYVGLLDKTMLYL